jgi:ADP-ribosylglycohydrolase
MMGERAERARNSVSHFTGCLLGGAVGDALGAPVELQSLDEIRRRHGGLVRDFLPAYGRLGAITDDTQMTLFTAEGLLRHSANGSVGDPVPALYRAYLNWLSTQGETVGSVCEGPNEYFGRLLHESALHHLRAPGNTCLSALRSGLMGTIQRPINDSKGCGGVMRVAPIGLCAKDPFRLGSDAAAITHGHPTGYLAAGTFALIISRIIDGDTLSVAIDRAAARLSREPRHEKCLSAMRVAIDLASSAPAAPETVERLGGGWVAEEALAIAVYCALAVPTFEDAVALAVTHSGDSDSTGAMTGNILGAHLGVDAIPPRWLQHLELAPVIEAVARDVHSLYVRDVSPGSE